MFVQVFLCVIRAKTIFQHYYNIIVYISTISSKIYRKQYVVYDNIVRITTQRNIQS